MPRRQRYEWLYECAKCGFVYRSPLKVSQVWCPNHKHELGKTPEAVFIGKVDNYVDQEENT